MLIPHPRIVQDADYPYGRITQADKSLRTADGSDYAWLGDRVFNVHRLTYGAGGCGIRWELSAGAVKELNDLIFMGIYEPR
jgi:hypothetical protein